MAIGSSALVGQLERRAPGRHPGAAIRRTPRMRSSGGLVAALDDRVCGRANANRPARKSARSRRGFTAREGTLAGMRALVWHRRGRACAGPGIGACAGARASRSTARFRSTASSSRRGPAPSSRIRTPTRSASSTTSATRTSRRAASSQFLSLEPARVAAATSEVLLLPARPLGRLVVQDDGRTETYSWDGSYYFDKAKGAGGAYIENFTVNNQSGDPTAVPGFPEEWKPYFGYGRGGVHATGIGRRRPVLRREGGGELALPARAGAAARAARLPGGRRQRGPLDRRPSPGCDPRGHDRGERRAEAAEARLLPLLRDRRRQVHGRVRRRASASSSSRATPAST